MRTIRQTSDMAQKKQINTRVPDDVFEAIEGRANLIQESQSGYLGLIAQWWFAQGMPAVTEYEAKVLEKRNHDRSTKRAS